MAFGVCQGYWPDGLYTAPSDAALQWDIATAQALGFNTLRKHMKVEPARWYYAADRAGLLVWQDMPAMCESPSCYQYCSFHCHCSTIWTTD